MNFTEMEQLDNELSRLLINLRDNYSQKREHIYLINEEKCNMYDILWITNETIKEYYKPNKETLSAQQ